MDDLLRVLGQHAADFADVSMPVSDWQVVVNSVSTRITAATKELVPTPEQAWHAAEELRDAIVDLGYELGGESELGAKSELDPAANTPGILRIAGWRGYLNIVVSTR